MTINPPLTILFLVLGISFTFNSSANNLASDGKLGSSSVGEIPVILQMPQLVKISALDAVNFTESDVAGSLGGLEKEERFCVYSNSSDAQNTGQYSITFSSNNLIDGAFAMSSSAGGDSIPYSLNYNQIIPGESTVELVNVPPNRDIPSRGANTTSYDCSGQETAYIKVSITGEALQRAANGSYSDVLIATVSTI
ncbi:MULTISPECIES: hypothetical protein [Gammaproteobacteria]|uniref:hypothetical protein n=1 Tax=Gammaproteobacteria TaxID=1236 RepID=UPI001ADD3473|nr:MULTISPECIES: hypothetical protein [Gammaproteobacteria]MBO9482809.1 hypothetical protein [Salinisphaera sp. G21_0]MBO9495173.1 hypothetical protein [Thalassotalea sp. G20_0]